MTNLSDYVAQNSGGAYSGVWTPDASNRQQIGSALPDNGGSWVRVGKLVSVTGIFHRNSFSGGTTTTVRFDGLPFNISADLNDYGYTGIILPQLGMKMNESGSSDIIYATSGIHAALLRGTKEYYHQTYLGTNDQISPNTLVNSQFQHFSTTVKFSINAQYITDDP